MTDKAYIVVNEQQEHEVLEKLEHGGFTWWGGDNLTENTPSKLFHTQFPYTIFVGKNTVTFNRLSKLEDEEIVFDGRKEEKMKIPENIYNMLVEWRDALELKTDYVTGFKLHMLNDEVHEWAADVTTLSDNHNRYIAILQWLNGEDVFEVEKPKKWVVRSKDRTEQGSYLYIYLIDSNGVKDVMTSWTKDIATKFDTKEEAESWANAHQEVIEVEA